MFVVFFSRFLCFQGIFVIIFGLFFVCFCTNCSFFSELFVFFQPIPSFSNKFSASKSSFRGGFLCLFVFSYGCFVFLYFSFFLDFLEYFLDFLAFFRVFHGVEAVVMIVIVVMVAVVLIIAAIMVGVESSEEAQKADLRLLEA